MKKKKNINKVVLVLIFVLILGFLYVIYNNIIAENDNKKQVIEDKKDTSDKTDKNKNDEKIEDDVDNDNNEDIKDASNTENNTSIPKTEVKENNSQVEAKNLNVSRIELIGDEEITLNVGDKYVEYGAKAYNTDGVDISSEIKIDSSLDTSKQGKYTVSYSIGNWIVMRYIIVK